MEQKKRQSAITRTAVLGIIVNLLIAAAKFVIGFMVSSLAIISEGVNNATDAGSSFLTLVGAKLSAKHPDEKHPFGYGRIEYLTGMAVGFLILYAGIEMLKESVDGIIHPGEMSVSVLSIAIVAGAGIIKALLGLYTIKVGKQTESDALKAVGEECRNDSLFSIVTIASGLLFLWQGLSLDAFVGLLFSLLVIKSGAEALKSTVSALIGASGKENLAKELYTKIAHEDGILCVADMMLHDYGPGRYSGSVNIEVDHNKSVGEIYERIHALQIQIMQEYNVAMVFGIYAVDKDSPESKEMREYITEFVRKNEHIKSFHALYMSRETGHIYCDFIVDYQLEDWEGTEQEFVSYMAVKYPENEVVLTIETEFV